MINSLLVSAALMLPGPEPATAQPTIKVGDPAPEFALPNHDGKNVTLKELRQSHAYVAVVFVRSADW